MEKVTEAHIQAALMRHAMLEFHHEVVIPNSNQFYPWEADLLSITKAGLVHEFEIKITKSDYKRDSDKHKHNLMKAGRGPSYFWYVTYQFEIDPPENAGWILVKRSVTSFPDHSWVNWNVDIKKNAPRLRMTKLESHNIHQISRLLSWRICNMFMSKYLREAIKEK